MEFSEKDIEKIKKEARDDGYQEALTQIRAAIRMSEMSIPDCEIVKKTDLPPFIIHAILKDNED